MVSAEDGAVPQRQRAELPHQVRLPISVWGLSQALGPGISHKAEEVTAKFLQECLKIGGLGQC